MTQLIEIPFVRGQDEGVDRALLDPGTGLRLLQNARLDRDGRIEVRPTYTALDMSDWGSGNDVVAYDLTTFEDRLIALGDVGSAGHPTGLWVLTNAPAAPWRGLTSPGVSRRTNFSTVSELEVVWTASTGLDTVGADVAYANGLVAVASSDPSTETAAVWLLSGPTILTVLELTSVRSVRVVACGNTLVCLARLSSGDITARLFDTAADTTWGSPATLVTGLATGTFTWDACAINATSYVICYPDPASTDIEVERWTTGGVNSWRTTINVTPGNMGLTANTTYVMFAYVDASSDARLYTIDAVDGSVDVGPTVVLGPGASPATDNCVGTPALLIDGTRVWVECSANTGTTVATLLRRRNISSHTASLTKARQDDIFVASKLFGVADSATSVNPAGVGTLTAFGNALGTDMLFASTIQSLDSPAVWARWNYAYADRLNDSRVTNYHGRRSVATDGAGTYWAVVGVLDEGQLLGTGAGSAQLVRFRVAADKWRQSAEMQGALYVAGGFIGGYDGTALFEAGGFLDTPVIFANTQGTAGSLTQLATYNYVAGYEWRDAKGRLHRSALSAPFEVVMTGVNDENTLTVSTAHSVRRFAVDSGTGTVDTALFRTTPDDSVLYRIGAASATISALNGCPVTTINDRVSDTDAQDNAVVYTQAQKPIENVGFYPCRFIAAGRDRLIMGGLPDPYMVAFSQLPFPGEPMNGADIEFDFAYQTRLPEKCTGVVGFGDSYVAFTASGIYEIPGAGPQRNGTGEFFAPRALYSDGGCIDWRSIVETSFGVMFQMAPDKLYMLGPGGEVSFVGKRVRDTLRSYPIVRAAALCTDTQRVVFAVVDNDDTPTAGGLLVYDLIHDAWSFDSVGVVDALCEYDGRVALIQSGVVYLEEAAVGVGAMPTMSVRTGAMRLFSGLGQGTVCKIGLVGTYLGDCTVEGFISYDDGGTWVSMGQQSVTAANYFDVEGNAIASGDTCTIIYHPKRREVDRFAVRFDVSGSSGSAGIRMHMMSLEVEGQTHTSRQPARYQR